MLRVLLIANALLQWLDASSTLALLWAGGAEGNPLMRRVLEEAGIGGFMFLKLALALAILAFLPWAQRLRRPEERTASRYAGAFAVMMVAVVTWNTHIVLSA